MKAIDSSSQRYGCGKELRQETSMSKAVETFCRMGDFKRICEKKGMC